MENKLARLARNTGPLRFFLPIGIILLVMGIILLRQTPKQYEVTNGVITNIYEYEDEDGDPCYDIDFDYTVYSKQYSGTFTFSSDDLSEGDTIPVYYDPANPENISNTKHTGIISIVMIGLGALSILLSSLATIKAFRKDRELDERIAATGGSADASQLVIPSKSEQTEYYVSFDGKTLKPGYIVEDAARKVVYEAPMTKNALVGARIFTFTNHLNGLSQEHEVGHTVTTSYSNEYFSMKSWFNFDGKNIWDVLHDYGIRIDSDLLSKFPHFVYTVSLNGRYFATIETSGQYVHEEDAAQHKINIPMNKYYYRCWTNSTDLDLLFLTVFALSETEVDIAQ